MNIFQKTRFKLRSIFTKRKERRYWRKFNAANVSRLTASMTTNLEHINNTLRYDLRLLRARSREVSQNNPFAKRFFSQVVNGVCGALPFKFQSKVKRKNGNSDRVINQLIENVFKAASEFMDFSGRWKWNTFLRLITRTLAIDGEVLLRKHLVSKHNPKYGFQLQIIDIDRLDEQYNKVLDNGHVIHMGVEVDADNRVHAYHLLKVKPNPYERNYKREYDVIPANQMIHLFVPEFTEQVRGIPWVYAALLNMSHLGGFEEGMVVAARIGAAQMGFIEAPDGGDLLQYDGEDSAGDPLIEAEPGTFPVLPPGYKATGWNPKYPDAAVGPFIQSLLRGIAVGLDVAYHNLSGDMSGVNYSSARIDELNERDYWLILQDFTIDHLLNPVYKEWLSVQITLGNIKLTSNQTIENYYTSAYWQGRRWKWIDPAKEVDAKIKAIAANLTSTKQVIAEQGEDMEEVFADIKEAQELAEEMEITVAPSAPESEEGPATDDNSGDEDETGDKVNEEEPV